MSTLDRNIPDSGIHNCPCGAPHEPHNKQSLVRVVEPQRIGGKDHPLKGLVITEGYAYCKQCGIHSARSKTSEGVRANWNRLALLFNF